MADEIRNSDELRVTKERVLEAAKSCPDARRTLETLFPEAFKPAFKPGDRVRPSLSSADWPGDRVRPSLSSADWVVVSPGTAKSLADSRGWELKRFSVVAVRLSDGVADAFDPRYLNPVTS